jgi:RNA-binding protein
MSNSPLNNRQRRQLKALAQRLDAVVRVGKAGLSNALVSSVDVALTQHELVKVKFAELKEEKKELAPILAQKTGSQLIMQVGNVIVLYRQDPDSSRRLITL